jgi:hypothetical protein
MKAIGRVVVLAAASFGINVVVAQGVKDMPMKPGSPAATHKATGTVKKADTSRGTVALELAPSRA